MHVALVCPYSLDAPGGVATHVMGLAAWLASRRHRVSVIAPGNHDIATPSGVTLHLLGRSRDFHFNGSVAQLAVGRRQAALAVGVARDADVVHVHEPLTPGMAFAVARRCSPVVMTHHASFDAGPLLTRILRRRAALLRPAASIAVSRAARATARAATGTEPTVIGNGLQLPPPPAVRDGWRGGTRPRIGFLGRLSEPRKGFDTFRAMALQSRASGLDAQFVALGPGHVDPGPVHLLGPVDDTTRDHVLRQVDVLVAPNLRGESFGLVLVEALAAGCAVVASDLPGFRDVLEAAGTGNLFPVGDATAALAALQETLAAPPDPLVLHESARRWGWDVLGPLVVDQYDEAMTMGNNTSSVHRPDNDDGLGWAT